MFNNFEAKKMEHVMQNLQTIRNLVGSNADVAGAILLFARPVPADDMRIALYDDMGGCKKVRQTSRSQPSKLWKGW